MFVVLMMLCEMYECGCVCEMMLWVGCGVDRMFGWVFCATRVKARRGDGIVDVMIDECVLCVV